MDDSLFATRQDVDYPTIKPLRGYTLIFDAKTMTVTVENPQREVVAVKRIPLQWLLMNMEVEKPPSTVKGWLKLMWGHMKTPL